MAPRLETRPPASARSRAGASRALWVTIAIAFGLAGVNALDVTVFDDPALVDRVTFANQSDYDVSVAVSSDGKSWMPVGVALKACSSTVEAVVDQGAQWHVRFRAQGRDGGEAVIDRSQLERDGWTIAIPDSVEQELSAAGAPPSPRVQCRS